MRNRKSDQPVFEPELVSDGEMEEALSFLLDRASEFVTACGGPVPEDLLIGHLFGAVKSPGIWRPLFLRVMNQSRDLRRRIDGTWGFINTGGGEGSLLSQFVAIDVETTGLKPSDHRVIEVGLVRFVDGEQSSVYGSLCNPGRKVPAFITKLTSIRNEDVEHAKLFEEIADEIEEFIGEDLVVGHNVSFDLRFLNAELKRANHQRLVNDSIDVMALAPKLLPQLKRPSLDKVAIALGLPPRKIHRAVGDADLAARALVVLAQIAADQGIGSLDQLRGSAWSGRERVKPGVGRAQSILDRQLLADVPDSAGVYVMRDRAGAVLYIGKSKKLKDRVRSYFSQPLGYTRKMDGLAESVHSIRCEQTGTELEALLLEAQLIRRYQPRYNKALRNHEQYPYIRIDIASAWPRVSMAANRRDDGALYFGPYRSRSGAKKAVELLSDLYPLRTCPRSFKTAKSYGSPCVRLDLKKCLGPCVGQADRGEYKAHVNDVIRFLDGEDERLLSRIHVELEAAADQQDFERARRLRNAIQTLGSISAEWRGLRDLSSRGDFAIVLPTADQKFVNVMLLFDGRMWATVSLNRSEGFLAAEKRFQRAWQRRRITKIGPVNRENVDEHAILHRWLDRHPGHPAIVLADESGQLNWREVHQIAVGITGDEFENWQPPQIDYDDRSEGELVGPVVPVQWIAGSKFVRPSADGISSSTGAD